MVFLGIRTHGYPQVHHLGRETFLAPVQWDSDGWPMVGNRGVVDMEYDAPGLPFKRWGKPDPKDDFEKGELDQCWNFLKNPDPWSYSLSDRPGWLRLSCSKMDLNGTESPSFVGRRQQHFACRAAALMDFSPNFEGDEAGLTVFMNRKHHYEIAVTREGTGRCILVRRRIGELISVAARAPIPEGEIILEIEAETGRYTFSYGLPDGESQRLAIGESRYLSSEVAGGFTGVYLAMYASAAKTAPSDSTAPSAAAAAYFDWFEYRPISKSQE
jgi:alpha-N-arabinofuranosidase